jgi:hypothetical protein
MTDLVHGQNYDVTFRLMYSSNYDAFYGNCVGYINTSIALSYTKSPVPFPTRVGSAILALGPAGVENKLYFRVADSEFPWHSPAANDSFYEHQLELISVEYVPND